jgi:hypothetical protein
VVFAPPADAGTDQTLGTSALGASVLVSEAKSPGLESGRHLSVSLPSYLPHSTPYLLTLRKLS